MNAAENWRPLADLTTLKRRADLLARARNFFSQREVLEIETPLAGTFGVTESQIKNIAINAGGKKLWLRTSPEYHMKRLLAAGSPDIYQIGKCFRDGEEGSRHQIEFTMIEWYRHEFTLQQMHQECCELIVEMSADAALPVQDISVQSFADLFQEHCKIDALTGDAKALEVAARQLLGSETITALGASGRMNRDTWLDLLTGFVVYPALAPNVLHVITDYPAEQAMLARLNPENSIVAERFEIILNGLELANGYYELRNVVEQKQRFARDREKRAELGLPDMLPDLNLLEAIESGLPDCCGVALGLDRTLMAIAGLNKIEKTLAFRPGG
jgi:lysyl-tRNA synthetase class 2